MPLAFPSHPGLVAPLWRAWPRVLAPLACGIGAAVPDVVDGAIGIARGELGQGIGHGLFGSVVLCVPVGLALHAAARALLRRVAERPATSVRWKERIARWVRPPVGAAGGRRFAIEAWSVWIGAISHQLFDFVSHGNFLWLAPWYEDPSFFPEWWYERWMEIPLPGYAEPYPLGPHLLVWVVLSAVGAWLFFPRSYGARA